jgi:hypothetical protein
MKTSLTAAEEIRASKTAAVKDVFIEVFQSKAWGHPTSLIGKDIALAVLALRQMANSSPSVDTLYEACLRQIKPS